MHIAKLTNAPLNWYLIPALALALSVPAAAAGIASAAVTAQTANDSDDNICQNPPFNGDPSCNQLAVLKQNQGFTAQDAQHLIAIAAFLLKNPNPQLLQNILSNPVANTSSSCVSNDPAIGCVNPNGDGTWSVTVQTYPPGSCRPGDPIINCTPAAKTVSTLGLSSKLSGIYHSVVFAGDRNAQLALYAGMYNSLPPGFLQQLPNGATLPTPASLGQASLGSITNALALFASYWEPIISFTAHPLPSPAVICEQESGAGLPHSLYGDRTGNSDSSTFSTTGIFANVDITNKSYVSCVKDQGKRAISPTFGLVSALEEKYNLAVHNGAIINLSEQDLMEHYRLLWSPGYEHETGDPWKKIVDAYTNAYLPVYESDWDYNPSLSRGFSALTGVYVNSCLNYPNTEPGCSDSAPQAPGICEGFTLPVCMLHAAVVNTSGGAGFAGPAGLVYLWFPNNTNNPRTS